MLYAAKVPIITDPNIYPITVPKPGKIAVPIADPIAPPAKPEIVPTIVEPS